MDYCSLRLQETNMVQIGAFVRFHFIGICGSHNLLKSSLRLIRSLPINSIKWTGTWKTTSFSVYSKRARSEILWKIHFFIIPFHLFAALMEPWPASVSLAIFIFFEKIYNNYTHILVAVVIYFCIIYCLLMEWPLFKPLLVLKFYWWIFRWFTCNMRWHAYIWKNLFSITKSIPKIKKKVTEKNITKAKNLEYLTDAVARIFAHTKEIGLIALFLPHTIILVMEQRS